MNVRYHGFTLCFMIVVAATGYAQYSGTPDPTFSGNGIVTDILPIDDMAKAVVVLDDGSILVSGSMNNGQGDDKGIILRFTAPGKLDTSFGNGMGYAAAGFGPLNDFLSLAVQKDGKILTAGYTVTEDAKQGKLLVARFFMNGALDKSFGTGGAFLYSAQGRVLGKKMVLDAAGRIVVVGYVMIQDFPHLVLCRLTPDGKPDSSFNGSGFYITTDTYEEGHDVAIQSDGKIVVVGSAWDPRENGWGLAFFRFTADGRPDPSFTVFGRRLFKQSSKGNFLYALAIQADGKIIGAGSMPTAKGWAGVIYRLRPNADVDTTFGHPNGCQIIDIGATETVIYSLLIDKDGKISACGYANTTDKTGDMFVARLSSKGDLDQYGVRGIARFSFKGGAQSGLGMALTADNGTIVVGGRVADDQAKRLWNDMVIIKLRP